MTHDVSGKGSDYTNPQVGDIVTYAEFGTPRRYTVTALTDGGLRIRLADELGDIGYAVGRRDCVLVERPTPAPALTLANRTVVPQARPAQPSTATHVTDPQHLALAIAAERGRVEVGEVTAATIRALDKRGYLLALHEGVRKHEVTGGAITHAGRVRLAQLNAQLQPAA